MNEDASSPSFRIEPQSRTVFLEELKDVLQRHSIPEEIINRVEHLDFSEDQTKIWENLLSIIDEALQSKSW